ncbi:MAG: N(G),N(G)-dimethylarginine dimethylaminohydrolase [candidate division Zixibacteria bacterium]|nr:N(G),N(G)-dimethylarginine dimethylaminohydrolase [candidate division Zixibacteria bacterium]
MRFTKAIVRIPGPSMVDGLSSAGLGKPDYEKALAQHAAYIDALKLCGLEVTILPPDNAYSDSTFVEDTTLLTPACAVIMRPGAPSRRGETETIETALRPFYSNIERIISPGTADAGDIMMVGNHFYIGLSQRTNREGAEQIIGILNKYDMNGSTVTLKNALHLKSGTAYLENEFMVLAGEFVGRPEFTKYRVIPVHDDEIYAANCLWLNGTILIAAGYNKIKKAVESCGYKTIALDMSEFRKLDGGLSCLSLRF